MSEELARTQEIMATLLGEHGCPWTKAQTHATLSQYAIEEAYELAWAIALGDTPNIREELGDLLLQVVYHAGISPDFTLDDVAAGLNDKLIRRHPHVFGNVDVADRAEVADNWEAIKAQEKAERTDPFEGIAPDLAQSPVVHCSKVVWRARDYAPVGQPGEIIADLQGRLAQVPTSGYEQAGQLGARTPGANTGQGDAREPGEPGEWVHLEAGSPGASMFIGEMLYDIVRLATALEVDPDHALRQKIVSQMAWCREQTRVHQAASE